MGRSKHEQGRKDMLAESVKYGKLEKEKITGISEMIACFDDGKSVDLVLKRANGAQLGDIKPRCCSDPRLGWARKCETCGEKCQKGKFTMKQAKEALTQVAIVLKNVHDKNFAHGDLHRHFNNVMTKINKKANTVEA